MYVETDLQGFVGEVKERNRFFRALQNIKELSENINENNFEEQSKLIAETCKQALKNHPNNLSKKMKDFIENYESRQEAILSGEINEKFQI